MAPSRRKGRASAAAAQQQWKVGDLVLAKMKGFPPWPATISEPQKWGYSSDRKKLLVYFFGTKQIAFCNHADIEAFTEEKKKTLLVKRQGKGADFVRAVDEIVSSFEKLKEQIVDDEFSSGDEAIESNVGNMECSSISCCIKSPKEHQPSPNCQPEAICASMQGNNLHGSEEIPVTSTEYDTIQNKDAIHEQPNGGLSILDQLRKTPLATTGSLRKRSRDTLSQTSDVKRRAMTLRRLRSSTRVDLCNTQKSEIKIEADNFRNDLVSDVLLEESSLNNRMSRKSPATYDTDLEASTLVPNNSCADFVPESAIVESGAQPLNEGCTVELNCKPGFRIENADKGLLLNGTLDMQSKMVVLKKKRKPNKKRFDQEMAAHAKLEKETFQDAEPNKNLLILSESCQSINEKHGKIDGDEHLPLVKRARVRMGNLPEEGKLDDLSGTLENAKNESVVNDDLNISSNLSDTFIANETLLNARTVFSNSSPSNDHMQAKEYGSLPWKGNKRPFGGSTMDVEAALPPSKRLHRALEAMSANAAEASNVCMEDSSSLDTSTNGHTFAKTGVCNILLDENSRSPRQSHDVLSPDTNEVSKCVPGLPSSSISQIPNLYIESSSKAKHVDISHGNFMSVQSADCKGDIVDVKDANDLSNKTVTVEFHDGSTRPSFVEARDKKANVAFAHSSFTPSPSSITEKNAKEVVQVCKESPLDTAGREDGNLQAVMLEANNGSSKPVSKNVGCVFKAEVVDNLKPVSKNVDCVLKAEVVDNLKPVSKNVDCVLDNLSPLNSSDTADSVIDRASKASHLSGDLKSSSSLSDEKCGVSIQEVAVEVKHKLTPKGAGLSPESTPMKDLIAAAQAKRFRSRSGPLPEIMNCKHVSDGLSRSSLIYYEDKSVNKFSPPSSVTNHTPVLNEETNALQSNRRSPDANLQLKNAIHLMDMDDVRVGSASIYKHRNLNRPTGHGEAVAARKSFETLLSTLSRTKDSIGRATRIAIDCAKYGIAGEVVQILLQNLEKEVSLNRRLDLFFLVDSITQCSRGQKGVAGDAYPSLVQSVLPRLLSAAAPPGNAAWDNRRQCLKVLRLWLERKTLPESIVRHHIRELDSVNEASFSSGSSRRPPRTERPLNDPVREMEGMLVDEYGSNASFQIPGFLGSRILDDEEESADDEKSFETVTPDHNPGTCNQTETSASSIPEKHTHILEDVDGELEMEDASPPREAETSTTYDTKGVSTEHASHFHFDKHVSSPFAPPLPVDNPPSPPPLPSSPPPVAGPPCLATLSHVPPLQPTISHNHPDALDSHLYIGRNNMQYPLSTQRSNAVSVNLMPSDRVDRYAPGYVDHPKQMQLPVSSVKSSGSYAYPGGSHSCVHSTNDTPPLINGPVPNKGYHLQSTQTVSNQFSHCHSEKQHTHSWGDCAPLDRRVMFAPDAQGGHFCVDRCARGPIQHEMSERCRFSAAVHSGPMLHEKVEASANLPANYGPPAETSSIQKHSWSIPPRASTYHYTLASRPPLEDQVSRVAEAHDYWRPR